MARLLPTAAVALTLLLATGAGAGPPSPSPLAPPGGDGDASGTITRRERRGVESFLVRARRLDRRADHALRFAGGADLAEFRTGRLGRARLRMGDVFEPGGAPIPLGGRPVEVVRLGDGEVVLEGAFPGGIVDDGPTTRLPGVDLLGPFETHWELIDLPTAPGGLDPGDARVYRPDDGEGALPPGEFPVVVVLHGMTARASHYHSWGRHLASWGFVVLVGDHADPIVLIDHEKQVATALGYAGWAAAADADEASPFFGRLLEDRVGLLGHSLGGGTAVVASTRASAAGVVKAAVAFAPMPLVTGLPPVPLPPDFAAEHWPPTLVMAGAEDIVILPSVSKAAYFDLAPAPRAFLRMDGFYHTGFSDGFPLGDYDPLTCVTNAEQLRHARQYAVPWFLFHLAADARVSDYVDGAFAAEDASAEAAVFE